MSQDPIPQVRSRTRPEIVKPALSSIVQADIDTLQRANRVTRRRSQKQVEKHSACMVTHKFDPPILATRSGQVVFGHDTLEAYRLLGRERVPVIYVEGRTQAQLKALALWLEGFHAAGEWDEEALQGDFELILEMEPDLIGAAFWDLADIDLILQKDFAPTQASQPKAEDAPAVAPPVTQIGDVFVWPSGHRLICGNSRHADTYAALMAGRSAQILATDPPFGTSVAAISSRHGEWKEGSGMSEEEAQAFFTEFLQAGAAHLTDGALAYLFIDWKGMYPLQTALRTAGLVQKSLCTWDKLSPGMGGFYRNQSEHVIVAKHGRAKHVFNRGSGQDSTIWSVPGYSRFRPDREEALAAHACTKPQGLLIGILLAGANIGDVCLDPFCGSGSMMLAAEQTKRICYGIEIEERFVDTTIARMHRLTGVYPVHEASGLDYLALAAERGVAAPSVSVDLELDA